MSKYHKLLEIILDEHKQVLTSVDDKEVDDFIKAIIEANSIQVFGMGRMKCAVRAFVMRLMHMGFKAHVVFDTTCPNIGIGDLLIINGACTSMDNLVMNLAKKAGAKIAAITAHPESEFAKLCDLTVRLKGQVNPGTEGEIPSVQPMAALFEQTIFVFEDIVIQLLMEKLKITPEKMSRRHTNLDGYMDLD